MNKTLINDSIVDLIRLRFQEILDHEEHAWIFSFNMSGAILDFKLYNVAVYDKDKFELIPKRIENNEVDPNKK